MLRPLNMREANIRAFLQRGGKSDSYALRLTYVRRGTTVAHIAEKLRRRYFDVLSGTSIRLFLNHRLLHPKARLHGSSNTILHFQLSGLVDPYSQPIHLYSKSIEDHTLLVPEHISKGATTGTANGAAVWRGGPGDERMESEELLGWKEEEDSSRPPVRSPVRPPVRPPVCSPVRPPVPIVDALASSDRAASATRGDAPFLWERPEDASGGEYGNDVVGSMVEDDEEDVMAYEEDTSPVPIVDALASSDRAASATRGDAPFLWERPEDASGGEYGNDVVGSMVEDDGKCAAKAAMLLGIFGDLEEAVRSMDAIKDSLSFHRNRYIGLCSEAITKAVIRAGCDVTKLVINPKRPDRVDLRTRLSKGWFLLDGTLNQDWYLHKSLFTNGAPDEVGPEHAPHMWRHMIAVIDGTLLEYTTDHGVARYSSRWLWIGEDGVTPDPRKGYMRHILKVYEVTPRTQGARARFEEASRKAKSRKRRSST